MALNFRSFTTGVKILGVDTLTSDTQGEIQVDNATGKASFHNGSSRSPLVTEAHTATLTNKTLTGNTAENLVNGAGQINFNTTGTVTVPDTTDTLVGKATTDTFTNKTIDADATGNVITNLEDENIKVGANITRSKLANGTAYRILANDATGVISENAALTTDHVIYADANGQLAGEQFLSKARGGTAADNSSVTFPTTGTIVTEAGTQTLTNKTIDASLNTISNIDLTTDVTGILPKANGGTGYDLTTEALELAEITTPTTPASGFGRVYFKSDGFLYQLNDAGVETKVGSGSGSGINYVLNPDAEASLDGWVTYAGGTTSPTSGTGGSPTHITLTRSTTDPLRDVASFLVTNAGGTSAQGEGVSYDFTIDDADLGKVLEISFDYQAGSGFTASSGQVGSDSDLEVFIYDVTNALLIPVQPKVLTSGPTTYSSFQGSFQTPVDSNSYRLILHVPTTGITAWTMKFDNVRVGPPVMTQGTPVTDWTAYTPTGGWTGAVSYAGRWRRVGDSMEVQVQVACSSTPTGTTLTIDLPSGYTIDTTKVLQTNSFFGPIFGQGILSDNLASAYRISATYFDDTSIGFTYSTNTSDLQAVVSATAPITFDNTDSITATFKVPIAGWSSQVEISSEADTRVVSFSASISGSTNSDTATPINFGTINKDTHAAYSSGNYTVPVSGDYEVYINAAATNGATVILQVYLNGSLFKPLILINGTDYRSASILLPNLLAGTVVSFRTSGSATMTDSAFTVGISRVSGPAAIAASEKVYAKYQISGATSNTSLANDTNEIIDFNIKVYDSHNAVTTGASWKFTAPKSAVYSVKATSRLEAGGGWAAGELTTLRLFKNNGGSPDTDFNSIIMQATHSSAVNINGATDIFLNAGEFIDVRQYQNSGAALNFNTSGTIVNVSITSQE